MRSKIVSCSHQAKCQIAFLSHLVGFCLPHFELEARQTFLAYCHL